MKLALVILAILLAGCANPSSGGIQHPADSLEVEAIKVKDNPTQVLKIGAFESTLCARALGPCTAEIDTTIPDAVAVAKDPDALFWRIHLNLTWASESPLAKSPRLRIDALACTAETCVQRTIQEWNETGTGPIRAEYFLEPGETGLLVAVEPRQDEVQEGPFKTTYRLEGALVGFDPAGGPITLTH